MNSFPKISRFTSYKKISWSQKAKKNSSWWNYICLFRYFWVSTNENIEV